MRLTAIAVFTATAAATVAVVTVDADAASFNCNKARTKTEHAICGNSSLSSLDSQLAGLYKQALIMSCSGQKSVRRAQLSWIAGRNACGGSIVCLRNAYNDRISELLIEIDTSEGGSCQ